MLALVAFIKRNNTSVVVEVVVEVVGVVIDNGAEVMAVVVVADTVVKVEDKAKEVTRSKQDKTASL